MPYRLLLNIALFTLLCTACASSSVTEQAMKADYPDLGAAAELSGDVWLNTEVPLRLADLRGKVVLLDMWTFG
jgi:hypothetical protein